jgi:hypothetical protein
MLQPVVCCCVSLSLLYSVAVCCILLSRKIVPAIRSRSGLAEARTRLAALGEKKPPTTAGQLRELWPEIEAALARQHPLKAICECLEAGGVAVKPRTLTTYIARMRKSSAQSRSATRPEQKIASDEESPANLESDQISAGKQGAPQSPDPLANIRQSEAKRPLFDYRPELADPKKLI